MKKLIRSALLTALTALSVNLYAETAIFPYRVNNPSTFFNKEYGREYARLLSVAAIFRKGMDIQSPRDTGIDMKRLGLSPEKTITGEDLALFGRSRYIDYILTGSLSKAGKSYISKSILYSVREKKIVGRFHSRSGSLFRLAEKEMEEIFIHNPDKRRAGKERSLDMVFILDLSYRINNDWTSVKSAIKNLASKLIDEYGIDTRITLSPYGSSLSDKEPLLSHNSLLNLNEELEKLSPKGGPEKKSFLKNLAYAVKNIRWRKEADKQIIIITNSDPGHSGFAEGAALEASRRMIKIHSLTLGNIKGDEDETVRRLSEITGGSHTPVAYYTGIYKPDGERIYLYFEKGRVFRSSSYDGSWREGVVKNFSAGGSSSYPGNLLDEIIYDEKKTDINPYTLDETYTRLTGYRTIKKTATENNIDAILNRMIERSPGLTAAARVLLSDGEISVWVPVEDRDTLRFFRKRYSDKVTFPLGVSVRSAPDRLYGLTLFPEITGISSDYIPEMLKTGLAGIIKKREFYSRKGFFTPPLWFLDLKVVEIRGVKRRRDIRDQ